MTLRGIAFYVSIYTYLAALAFLGFLAFIFFRNQEKIIAAIISVIIALLTILFQFIIEEQKQKYAINKELTSNATSIYKRFFEFIEQRKAGRIAEQEVNNFIDTFEANITDTTQSKVNKIKACKPKILELAAKYGAANIRVYGSEEQNNTNKPEIDFIVSLESGRSLLDQSGLMIDLQELLGFEVYVFTENGF